MHRGRQRMLFAGALFASVVTLCVVTACAPISSSAHSLSAAPPTGPRAATRLITTLLPTTGCGKAPPIRTGTSANEALEVDGMMRTYRLHVPLAYAAERHQALVLAFHGHGNTATLFERVTGFSQLADAQDFIVAYPQGWIGPDGHTGWNTSRAIDPKVNDLLFVSDLLSRLQAQLCVDPRRIFATGISNGGGFTAVLACTFADRIAAFASVAGEYYPQPGGCARARPVPLLEIHGTADRIVPYAGSQRLGYPAVTEWLQGWAARDGCTTGPTVFYQEGAVTGVAWRNCQGDGVVIHDRIVGGVHVWPDSSHDRSLPPPDAQLDATDIIWSFFTGRALPRG